MDTLTLQQVKALDDSIKLVADLAAEIVKVKDAGGWSLKLLPDMLKLVPEAVTVLNESGDLVPELKMIDQETATKSLGAAYVAMRSLITAILYQPGAK